MITISVYSSEFAVASSVLRKTVCCFAEQVCDYKVYVKWLQL